MCEINATYPLLLLNRYCMQIREPLPVPGTFRYLYRYWTHEPAFYRALLLSINILIFSVVCSLHDGGTSIRLSCGVVLFLKSINRVNTCVFITCEWRRFVILKKIGWPLVFNVSDVFFTICTSLASLYQFIRTRSNNDVTGTALLK